MAFLDLINKYLIESNHPIIEGIKYQQYGIVEKKGFFYIFNEQGDKIISSFETLEEAKQRIDSIVSGC